MKRVEVKTYYTYKECSKCNKGRMDVSNYLDGLLMSDPPQKNYKCNLCDNEEILTESEWPKTGYQWKDENDD